MNTELHAMGGLQSWCGAFTARMGRVDLWVLPTATPVPQSVVAEYRELLSDAERAQELRFHFDRDRRRYLLTRALVRCVLSRYSSVRPEDWRFTSNAYGRPAILNDAAAGLDFNVSHTTALIMLAITQGARLGVDCESLSRRDCVPLAERFFAAPEVAALQALPLTRQQQRFFELWTLKESYIKARGMGLAIPLDEFSFALSESAIELTVDPRRDESAHRWQFLQILVEPNHIAAVCVERGARGIPSLAAYRAVPLLTAMPMRVDTLRASLGRRAHPANLFGNDSDSQS